MLDYVEDLYRNWNDGAHSGGGAAERIHVLVLRNSQLKDQVRRLHRRVADADPDIIALPERT